MMPATNSAGHQQLVLYTQHSSSRRSLLHLQLEHFTAYAVKPDIGSESQFLPTPSAFDAPIRGVPVGILFGTKEIEWLGYPTVKIFLKIFIRFDTFTNVTDRQTHTQTPHDGIGHAYA